MSHSDPLPDLHTLLERWRRAHHPEEVFGDLTGDPRAQLDEGRKRYRRLAQAVHPDMRYVREDNAAATEATALLNVWWERAQTKIRHELYGRGGEAVIIETRTRPYTITRQIGQGDFASLYHALYEIDGSARRGVFKVARDPDDNPLLENEAAILSHLRARDASGKFRAFYPQIIEGFQYRDDGSDLRRAHVLAYVPEIASPDALFTLNEVRAAYPAGLDPRDMAWMWRRLLMALDFAHKQGVVHGAVLPAHVLIEPALHGLVLIDWTNAVRDGDGYVPTLASGCADWYPPEVHDKQPPLPGMDITMGAACMVWLTGGDPIQRRMPAAMPDRMARYFAWCMTPSARGRPQDAGKLLTEFDSLLSALYGARQFRPLHLTRT
jgi:serine/threonine protein kinase